MSKGRCDRKRVLRDGHPQSTCPTIPSGLWLTTAGWVKTALVLSQAMRSGAPKRARKQADRRRYWQSGWQPIGGVGAVDLKSGAASLLRRHLLAGQTPNQRGVRASNSRTARKYIPSHIKKSSAHRVVMETTVVLIARMKQSPLGILSEHLL